MPRLPSKRLISLLFLGIAFSASAQPGKEAWRWDFGARCVLDFSTGAPVSTQNDSLQVQEGSASASDAATGQFLFYTDGASVWDMNNHRMPNGYGLMGGGGTSTQAALIVQKPGSNHLFYVFSADQGGYAGPNKGVHYSAIDMNLNGGLGDITAKNVLLTPPPATEKLTGVKHCNGIDYWVITHKFITDTFNAYLVSNAGVSTVPVSSGAGSVHSNTSGSFYETAGYLKASPNGKKLACAVMSLGFVEIFDFDNSTGLISNPVKIQYPVKNFLPYGLSFSPNSSLLYVSANDSSGLNSLYQFDISSGILPTILASKVSLNLGIEAHAAPGALQLGPDNKLYFTSAAGQYISAISNPNTTGLSCNLGVNTVNLFQGGLGASAAVGLPNFIDTELPAAGSVHNLALCNFNSYMLDAGSANGHFHWSTGDTTQIESISTYGSYWVTYIDNRGCRSTDTFLVSQTQPPVVDVLHDTAVCSVSNTYPVNIIAGFPNAVSYQWSDGATTAVHVISSPGIYWVDLTLSDLCVSRDSFNFYVDSIPSVNLGSDTSLCRPYALSAFPGEQYSWSTGDTARQIVATAGGTYFVVVKTAQGCTNSDTINLTIYTPPVINILKDTVQCGNSFMPVSLNAGYPNVISYNWSNAFTGQAQVLNLPGSYWVDLTVNNGCVARDSFGLYLYPYPAVDLGNDTTYCTGNRILNVYNPGCTYLWSTGETSPAITANVSAIYWVEVGNHGCVSGDTMAVFPDKSKLAFSMPNIVTPNNDQINDEIDFGLYQFSSFQIEIFNRWGLKIFEGNEPGNIWRPVDADGTYFYTLQYKIDCGALTEQKTLRGFITILR